MDEVFAKHINIKVHALRHLIPIVHVKIGVGDRDAHETQAFQKLRRTCLDALHKVEDQELVGWRTSELYQSRLRRFILMVVVLV